MVYLLIKFVFAYFCFCDDFLFNFVAFDCCELVVNCLYFSLRLFGF